MKRTDVQEMVVREPFVILFWHIDNGWLSVIGFQALDNSVKDAVVGFTGYECDILHDPFFTFIFVGNVHPKRIPFQKYSSRETVLTII